MVPFAGYEMPVQYSGLLQEARAVRSHGGLFDVSHMGQVLIQGDTALEEVNALVTNDLTRLELGQAQYNILCNEQGGAIDDLVVYRRGEKEIFICINAANRETDVKWFQNHLSNQVTFSDLSDELALLALQGPIAEDLIIEHSSSSPDEIKNLGFYWAMETQLFGVPIYLSRTGYTGEDGFELYFSASEGGKIWDQLLEAGKEKGLVPVGLGARDTLRLEMGYALHGHELSQSISPLEAGLGWAVKLKKESEFIGKQALQKQKDNGLERKLQAFTVQDRRIPRTGYPIVDSAGNKVGEVTSGTLSPHAETPIGVGFVSTSVKPEDLISVQVRDTNIPTTRIKLPFVPSHTKSVKNK